MKLQVSKRTAEKKSDALRLRREGQIPAILYVRGKAGENISISNSEMTSLLRNVQPGRLSTTIFNLADGKGRERKAILKEIQYHPTTYNILHLDFEELHDDQKVTIKVPVESVGVADCAGIKLGGVLRQVIRYLRVNCLPKDIPSVLELDVRNLALYDALRLSDLKIPSNVRPIANMNEVAVVIVTR